jgi:heptosyltransferase-2
MVMANGLVAALHAQFPGQPIDVLAPPATAPIAARMPEVRNAIEFAFSPHRLELAQRRRLARDLRGQYGTAYVLPGSWISALIPAMAGIPVRVGYLRELRYGLLNRIVVMPEGQKRKTADAYFRLAGASGSLRAPRLEVDVANQKRLLAEHRLVPKGFVALVPGAEGGSAKRWPAPHYAELARSLIGEGHPVALLGGPRDTAVTAEVATAAQGAIDMGGRTTLGDAVDLIAAARLAVANDSGLMHVAAAVGTPVIGIYGSTSPKDTPPLSELANPIWHELACSPCNQRECPFGHTACLNGIGAAEVLVGARRLIGAANAA